MKGMDRKRGKTGVVIDGSMMGMWWKNLTRRESNGTGQVGAGLLKN